MPKTPPDHSNRDFEKETAKKRQEGKDLGGRPAFRIDYDTLANLCGIFCTGEECAAVLGCSYQTLNLRLQEDYREAQAAMPENQGLPPEDWYPYVNDQGMPPRYNGFKDCFEKKSLIGKVSLRRTQFQMATGNGNIRPDKTMAIWMGKQHLGQKDRMDHSSSDGTMTPKAPPAPTIDLSALSHEDFNRLGEILKSAKTAPVVIEGKAEPVKH